MVLRCLKITQERFQFPSPPMGHCLPIRLTALGKNLVVHRQRRSLSAPDYRRMLSSARHWSLRLPARHSNQTAHGDQLANPKPHSSRLVRTSWSFQVRISHSTRTIFRGLDQSSPRPQRQFQPVEPTSMWPVWHQRTVFGFVLLLRCRSSTLIVSFYINPRINRYIIKSDTIIQRTPINRAWLIRDLE